MLVMKFGGASVKEAKSFTNLAKIILEKSLKNEKVVVVLSAMANTTDKLFELAKMVHPNPPKREQDMLVSVGERISIALLAMALAKVGKEAVSFTGSQSGIMTCENHSEARIIEMRPRRILEALEKKKIAIVAGFQGMSRLGEITTLGRGGSDTSAVALAASLGANVVEFYKDVGAIFSKDPKVDANSKKLSHLTFDEGLELSEKGAKVLHSRAIRLAKKNGIELHILSLDDPNNPGTIVGKDEKRSLHPQYEDLMQEVATCSRN